MKKILEAKPTASQLFLNAKFWLSGCLWLAVASPLMTAYAGSDGERHVYAKVFVEGTGVKHEFSYMRDVYLDVVIIPTKTVVERDSGILFTDVSYKKALSEIQVRALEFVEPHVKELGFETVSDYQVFLYPGDKDKVHFDRDAVEKFRADSFAIESKLSGPKAELHGVWIGNEAAPKETEPTPVEEKEKVSEKSPRVENASVTTQTQKSAPTPTTDAENAKAAAKNKKKVEKKIADDKKRALALAKKQAEEKQVIEEKAKTKAKAKEQKAAKQRAEGKVVKEMIFDDFIQESQIQSWCGRIAARVLKSLEASNHKLISMGSCSCKPGGDPGSPKKEFRCGFPVTYRIPPNNAE
jgi:flagellar biosynthesis GTPase FlhF